MRVFVGRDPQTGKRRWITRTVRGTKKDAEKVRNQLLVQVDAGWGVDQRVTVNAYLDEWLESVAFPSRNGRRIRRSPAAVCPPRAGREETGQSDDDGHSKTICGHARPRVEHRHCAQAPRDVERRVEIRRAHAAVAAQSGGVGHAAQAIPQRAIRAQPKTPWSALFQVA